MRLIVTRPKADAETLAAKLVARGHAVIPMPLLDITWLPIEPFSAVGVQAVCASSANGLKTPQDLAPLLHLPLYAVGPQSAVAARQAGFRNVHIANGGNLEALSDLVASSLDASKGRVLYLSGQDVSGDLAGLLNAAGFSVERRVVYAAVPVHPQGLAAVLANADGVLLYSPRSARLWLKAAADAGCPAPNISHFCLSANVAAVLPQSVPIYVADKPDEQGMLTLVDRHA